MTHSDSALTITRVGPHVEVAMESPIVRLTVEEAEAVVQALERAIEQTKRPTVRAVVH